MEYIFGISKTTKIKAMQCCSQLSSSSGVGLPPSPTSTAFPAPVLTPDHPAAPHAAPPAHTSALSLKICRSIVLHVGNVCVNSIPQCQCNVHRGQPFTLQGIQRPYAVVT